MHKILVLCQRKYDEYGNNLVNDQINDLVERLLGHNNDIKYVSNLKSSKLKGFVDYDGLFGDNDWTHQTFIPHEYSLIILNTSPLLYINHSMLKLYLKHDGIIAITIYSPHKLINNIEYELGNNMNQHILDHVYNRIYNNHVQDALLYKTTTFEYCL
jgi:hypothetical protein